MNTTEDVEPRPSVVARPRRPFWDRTKEAIVRYVLGVEDTPHRIALGVFLGFLVGATPTLGIQLIVYVALATITRANKLSGILPVFISNPITAVPLYYFNWWVGNHLTGGDSTTADFARRAIDRITSSDESLFALLAKLSEPHIWERIWRIVVELWVGSIVVGLVVGVPFYFITLEAVFLYRRRQKDNA